MGPTQVNVHQPYAILEQFVANSCQPKGYNTVHEWQQLHVYLKFVHIPKSLQHVNGACVASFFHIGKFLKATARAWHRVQGKHFLKASGYFNNNNCITIQLYLPFSTHAMYISNRNVFWCLSHIVPMYNKIRYRLYNK